MTQTQPQLSPLTDPSLYPDDRPSTGYGTGLASFICAMLGISLPAIVLGHVSRSQARRAGLRPHAWSRWGLFFGYLQAVIGTIVVVLLVVGLGGLTFLTAAGPVGDTLRSAVTAETTHLHQAGSFTTSVPALTAAGYHGAPGVQFTVVRADERTYCLRAEKDGKVLYASSYHQGVTKTACI